ncbi:MAG: thioredoxin family protein [Chloroflexi bacterium]|nr:thioredoxin family protein [Chloroflexota bacterium]
MAQKFAFESSHVTAEAISAVAMVALAQHYRVFSTPHIVLNGQRHLKGRVKEDQLLRAVRLIADNP